MVFECSHPGCEAKFRRREHLNRHSRCHSPQASFACPHCESVLTRNDLLRRHVRARHSQSKLPGSRTMTACTACRSRKERCRGGIPCDACRQRGNLCKSPEEKVLPMGPDGGEDRVHSQAQTTWQPRIAATPAISHISELNVAVPHTARWAAQDYVDNYFAQFHPEWPFLHRSTFDSAKEPCILVQSVLMVGLYIDGSNKARDAAEFLHAKVYSAIQDQKNQWCTSHSRLDRTTNISWLMPIYQSVLLNIILALLKSRECSRMNFSLRYKLSTHTYELLVTLVQTCRGLGLFHYPSMLQRYNDRPPPLAWIYVEEIKKFGLALYQVCQLSSFSDTHEGDTAVIENELLNLTDLEFSMPRNDGMWNASIGRCLKTLGQTISSENVKDESDPKNWISETFKVSGGALAVFN